MAETFNVRRFETPAERWQREQAALGKRVHAPVPGGDNIGFSIVHVDETTGIAGDASLTRLRSLLALLLLGLALTCFCAAALNVYKRYRRDTKLVESPETTSIERRAQRRERERSRQNGEIKKASE